MIVVMPISTFTSRQFSQDAGAAKRAAEDGPVYITDRGKLSHVLLTYDDYHKLSDQPMNAVEWLAIEGDDIEFDPPTLNIVLKPFEFDE